MYRFIAIVTAIFIVLSFFNTLPQGSGFNIFFSYYLFELQMIHKYLPFFVIGFLIASFLFMQQIHHDKKHTPYKKYLFSSFHVLQLSVISLFISYIFVLFIAVLQLNILTFQFNANPALTGVTTDTTSINKELKENDMPPDIVASDVEPYKAILAIAKAATGTTNIYGQYIVQSIPEHLVVPVLIPSYSMLLIDNTLILTKINPTDIQAISPTVAYLFAKNYFWGRNIKSYPKVSLWSRQEYLQHREAEVRKNVQSIASNHIQLENSLATLSATLEQNKNKLKDVQSFLLSADSAKLIDYRTCLKSQPNCQNVLATWKTKVSDNTKSETQLNTLVSKQQNQLQEYEKLDLLYKTQKIVLNSSVNNLPYELGVFEAPNSIKIDFQNTSSHSLADYFEDLTHEYIHYASYQSKNKTLNDLFFEEGLTEYFARNIIQTYLHTNTNVGYPIQARIIQEMTKSIPESDLADIYFSKDSTLLQTTLDRVYGDGFYENNKILFATIMYTGNQDQLLEVANSIMKKIGGKPLTKNDITSTNSSI